MANQEQRDIYAVFYDDPLSDAEITISTDDLLKSSEFLKCKVQQFQTYVQMKAIRLKTTKLLRDVIIQARKGSW